MSSSPPSSKRFHVLGAITIASAIAYLCRHPLGVAESTISLELGLTKQQSGMMMGTFFWTYAIFQLPGGWLGHVWGNRWTLSLLSASWSLAMLMTGFSTTFFLLLIAQLLMGAAQAGLFPCTALVIQRWLPIQERGLGQGALAAGMQVGAIATAILTGWMLGENISWRLIFMLYAVPGFFWAIWFALRFREYPTGDLTSDELPHSDDSESELHERVPWVTIFSHSTMWFLCGQQIFRAAGYAFFVTWFPSFLQETRDISIEKSGLLQGLLLLAALVGASFGGILTDSVYRQTGNLRHSRFLLGAGGQMACSLLIFAAFFVTSVPFAISLLAAGVFFTSLGGPSALAIPIDIGGKHVAKIFAVMNSVGNFAAAGCPILVGWVFDNTLNWNIILLLFAGIYFAATACWLFINPTIDVTQDKHNLQQV